MNSKNKQLQALQQASVSVDLSIGTVEITKIRPFDAGGHHVFDLVDALGSELGASEITLNLATVGRLLAKHFKPDSEPRAALEGAIKHCTGLDDLSKLDASDIVKIVLGVVELNMDFFAQAAPQMLARLTRKVTTMAK